MNYLMVHDWDEHQSYRKDRGQPPWIKVHRHILRNLKWVGLTDMERGHLVAIWLLAADNDGIIPDSPEVVQKLCFMSDRPNLSKFKALGFLDSTGCHGDVILTSERRQGDAPEENRVEENRVEEITPPISPQGGKRPRFKPPTADEVRGYCRERGNSVDPERWHDHYTANGWKVGKNPMKDWKAAVRTWESKPDEARDKNPSRAKRVSDKLDDIIRKSLAGEALDGGDL
jgi:hypothetical protein